MAVDVNKIRWREDIYRNDPVLSGTLYLSDTGKKIATGIVNHSPSYSVTHTWNQGGNVSGVLSQLASYMADVANTIYQWGAKTASEVPGISEVNLGLGSAIAKNDIGTYIPEYGGTTYGIEVPELRVLLLPTDNPQSPNISESETPLNQLKGILLGGAGSDSRVSREIGEKLTEGESNWLFQMLSDQISNMKNSDVVSELSTKSVLGGQTVFNNIVVNRAPTGFYRVIDQHPETKFESGSRMLGSCYLVCEGLNAEYKNLLIDSIRINYSKTRLGSTSGGSISNLGPSWIEVIFGLRFLMEPMKKTLLKVMGL